MTRARDIADRNVDSTTIDGVDSTQLLRSDVADTKTAGDLSFADNVKAQFGAGSDLQIYHDGNNSLINDVGTGDLRLRSNGSGVIVEMSNGNDLAQFLNGSGEAKLMHNGSEKLATTSTGINVTGTVTGDGLTVDASGGGLTFSGGGNTFISATSSPLIFQTSSGTERMRITGAGNVGIGSSSPEALLHVEGASTGQMMFRTSGSSVNKWLIGKNSSADFSIGEDGNEWLYVERDSGNVGIGTTSVDNKLHLEHAGSLYLQIENTSTANKFYLGNSGGNAILQSTGAYSMNFITNGSERMRIDSNGNVGIGTASPTNLANYTSLDIKGGTSGALLNFLDDDGTRTFTINRNDGGVEIYNLSNTPMTFYTNNTERMRIDSAGRVTMPYQPCCFAYKSGGGNSTSASGSGVLDTAGTNVGNHFSTSTGRFTCPVAGNYLVTWHAMNSQNNTGTVTAVFRVNGVGYSYFHIENSHPQSCSQQVVYSASAGDYFDLSISHFHFNGGSTYKYPGMSVVLIG